MHISIKNNYINYVTIIILIQANNILLYLLITYLLNFHYCLSLHLSFY